MPRTGNRRFHSFAMVVGDSAAGSWTKGATHWMNARGADVFEITSKTTRDEHAIEYQVSALFSNDEDDPDEALLWCERVYFGSTDAHVAGGMAFKLAARAQEKAALTVWEWSEDARRRVAKGET